MYDLSFLRANFDFTQALYAGVDNAICKLELVAKNIGVIPKNKLGIEIQVKEANCELTNEVKRIGYLKDREAALQLRQGDTVIVYISKCNA